MANAKIHITKKSLRNASGATDKAEQVIALARKEEEAIARMVKDFRRQERKKTSPTTRGL